MNPWWIVYISKKIHAFLWGVGCWVVIPCHVISEPQSIVINIYSMLTCRKNEFCHDAMFEFSSLAQLPWVGVRLSQCRWVFQAASAAEPGDEGQSAHSKKLMRFLIVFSCECLCWNNRGWPILFLSLDAAACVCVWPCRCQLRVALPSSMRTHGGVELNTADMKNTHLPSSLPPCPHTTTERLSMCLPAPTKPIPSPSTAALSLLLLLLFSKTRDVPPSGPQPHADPECRCTIGAWD